MAIPRHGSRPSPVPTFWPVNRPLPGAVNVAFFDGHVSLYPTQPFSRRISSAESTAFQGANPDNGLVTYYQETIFFLNKQKGR